MTLKCSAYLKSRHFCNDKDPTFDTNWAIFRWAKKIPLRLLICLMKINPKQTKGGRNQDVACLAASPGQ